MLKTPISLGFKYFRSRDTGYLSFYALISIIGLSLGVATLIIVLSVMNGFEKELQNRILGVAPQLIIKKDAPFLIDQDLIDQLDQMMTSYAQKHRDYDYLRYRYDELSKMNLDESEYRSLKIQCQEFGIIMTIAMYQKVLLTS